jgi:hypothetical protein
MASVPPIYLLDSGGQNWLITVTNNGQIQSTAVATSGVAAILLHDVTSAQVWRLSILPSGMLHSDLSGSSSTQTQLLVFSPNQTLWAIQFNNGALQTVLGTLCAFTFADARQQLANRLNDPGQVFWTDDELKVHILNALRFWNVLTGDNREWYRLAIDPTKVWYDLQTIAGSPRLADITDSDLYSWLQFALLEAQQVNAQLSTSQFTTDDLTQAVQRQRDEFLFRTGCTSTVKQFNVPANDAGFNLPPTIVQIRRAYWLPAVGNAAFPLIHSDEWEVAAFIGDMTPADPEGFSAGMEPPYTMRLLPPPNVAGIAECLAVESQALIVDPSISTTMYLPSDFGPALLWGALGDLLGIGMEASDPMRAKYCRERVDQFVELMKLYPSVFAARVLDQPVYVDAVEVLDLYEPTWRTTQANPSVVGLSGKNLVAFPCAAKMNISLLLLANADLPQNDDDCVVLGQDIADVILGYAQHTASFKMGGQEFAETMPLFENIVKMGAQKNAKIRAMSTFRDVLFGRAKREDEIAPIEKVETDG